LTAVEKSGQFEADFTAIVLYLSDKNPVAELRLIEAVEGAIALLGSHPELEPVWRCNTAEKPVGFLLVPGFHDYLIFYLATSAGFFWVACCTVRKICRD